MIHPMNSAASSRTRGFTLLELLVVVVIIGLLVGYVAPAYFGQVGKSEVTTAKARSTPRKSACTLGFAQGSRGASLRRYGRSTWVRSEGVERACDPSSVVG